uniref:Ubs_23 putative toxin n=1 Tax=Unedogemmula bisaya TaxID=746885 RepID=A0A098LXY8_UNEBI
MTCLPLLIVTIIMVYSINVAAGGQFKDACSSQADCDAGLECSKNKCLIPFDSPTPCSTGWDCVHGVWCTRSGTDPGKCDADFRCSPSGECEHPDKECDDGICGYKEYEDCRRPGPCKSGLICKDGFCLKGHY